MKTRLLALGLLSVCLAGNLRAEDDPEPKTHMKDILRERMLEDAKKQPAAPAATPANPAAAPDKPEKTVAPASTPAPAATPASPELNKKAAAKKAAKESATVLPKVEVKKARITVLDQQLAKQDEEIARERKNLKPTEVDSALNDAKVAKPLSIFGGDSTQFRKGVASERVQLMEAEKDIMTAIAQAKTKEEKQSLQKQLDELKAMRRELDKSMR